MEKSMVFETALTDALDRELCNIETLFESMEHMEHMENMGSYLVQNIGSLGKALVEGVRDNFDSLCEVLFEVFGEIEVVREDHHDDNLKYIEGFKVKFSTIIEKLASMDKFPPHVEMIKNYESPGSKKYLYAVRNVREPSSLVQREEGSSGS